MTTLVVGGTGFIGSNLVKHLCAQGEKVVSFSADFPEKEVDGCTYIQGDITEYGTINMIMRDYSIDRVIHNAAVSHPKLFSNNPYKIYRINVMGTLTSLEAARNYGVKRYVYISSGAVYGNTSLNIVSEDTPLHSENPYGATKVACEELVRNYGLDSVSIRVGFVYGPGREFECPINMILSDCIKKRAVNWDQGIDQKLDYIYIDDCVKGISTIAMADKLPHTEYNLGGGETVQYSRVVKKVEELYSDIPVHVGKGTLDYDNLGALSLERVYGDFGWKPETSIEEGIERYNEWLKSIIS